jgi:hypothetical protein
MILKLLLKIWPALTPIIIYCLWILAQKIAYKIIAKKISKAGKIINATYSEVNKDEENSKNTEESIGNFSLQNRKFIMVLYSSFFIAIICFLFFAIRVPKIENGKYVPAYMEDGKVVPGKIVK